MGDIHESTTAKRPGIAIVMPKLQKDTQENRALFRRWTKLHTRDILSLPKDKDLGGVSMVLRYTRTDEDGGEEYFLTNHLDDVRLLGSTPFQKLPHRLDLENTRALEEGEEAVLGPGDPRVGTDPTVLSIAAPVAGVFEEHTDIHATKVEHESYQCIPADVVMQSQAQDCELVTLTISSTTPISTSAQIVQKLQASLVSFLATISHRSIYSTLYRHAPYAKPEAIPKLADGQHGNGDWVVCAFVGGDADKELLEAGLEGLEGQVGEWKKRVRIEGSLEGLEVKIGVWRGDIFMSG
ncbi:uncharacterized protein EKO05_0002342 [Ascochyta rabiei]|uniref:Uncharacterized protein n=1 Tax=Didymella rabiei TaxID=5454 RepID=A0A162VMT5_DIDRA|nr:uncharacterized protein EKO05_0002342 [Ascochyta rabiei]KZM18538.1 hypothetical protein ST47_g10319 [Ascochyta rabiei]UPX11752.1 hypothetical protein EKO05_0002342 [Ascochyta rabiei]